MRLQYLLAILLITCSSCVQDSNKVINNESPTSTDTLSETERSIIASRHEKEKKDDLQLIGNTHHINGSKNVFNIEVDNQNIQLNGIGNTVKALGPAKHVQVTGSNNTLYISSSVTVTVSGLKNKVIYDHPEAPAKINKSGVSNIVQRGKW